jgi:hypothetical protein
MNIVPHSGAQAIIVRSRMTGIKLPDVNTGNFSFQVFDNTIISRAMLNLILG